MFEVVDKVVIDRAPGRGKGLLAFVWKKIGIDPAKIRRVVTRTDVVLNNGDAVKEVQMKNGARYYTTAAGAGALGF